MNQSSVHFLHQRQVVWFDAEVPVRQWNSICILRDIQKKKFQIYQNDELVFSYGECTTIGEAAGLKVTNQTCIQEEWKYSKNTQKMNFIGPCTNHNWQGYWCLVNITSPNKIYDPSKDYWGECMLSCMTSNQSLESQLVIDYKFSPELFGKMQIGSEIDAKVSFKGKIADYFMWETPVSLEMISKFMSCMDHKDISKVGFIYTFLIPLFKILKNYSFHQHFKMFL